LVRFLKKAKIYHLINSRNNQAKKNVFRDDYYKKFENKTLPKPMVLEINRQTYDQTLVVQTETIFSF